MRQRGECGPDGCGPDGYEGDGPVGRGPRLLGDPSMCALAWDLDHLERHIDWYGSVTAKVPDVWGQARLTQYRQDFETQMNAQLTKFQFALNGSISRTDQAYFASATALSFATQPSAPAIGRVTSTKGNAPSLVPTAQTVQQVTQDGKGGTTTTNTTLGTPASPPAPTPVKAPAAADPASLLPSTDPIKRNDATLPSALGFEGGPIQIEPTEYLAQMKRYLDLLAQFRRENEGDDIADSPGYSINVMRLPVSIFPGKRTDVGFGCEISMTASPVLGPELLPMTFRTLLTNDIVTQLGFPLTQILNQEPGEKGVTQLLNPEIERFLRVITHLYDYNLNPSRFALYLCYLNDCSRAKADRAAIQKYATDEIKQTLANLGVAGLVATNGTVIGGRADSSPVPPGGAPPVSRSDLRAAVAGVGQGRLLPRLSVPSLSFSNGLDNRTAVPTSQINDVYGLLESFEISFGAHQAFSQLIDQQGYAHLPDIQGYLKEECRAAYQFLEKNPTLWHNHCTPQLVQAIRSQQWELVSKLRQQYRIQVAYLTGAEAGDTSPIDPSQEPAQFSKTTALGWALIVDGALLTDRLLKDMRETASAKNKPVPGCDHWCPYFLPDPPPECRLAFNEYVKVRWPVRVFALDPYIQEQNIADSFSSRRETQLALSIAFTNGMINANQLTKFARRLEADYETIALNRTQVGFSHGENVFGWRFYPRFQTPDTESNLTVFFRDNLIGGPNRNQLLRQRRLEPGMRECVAVVLMPSFVPTVTVDTVSNWFPLTNPKHKVLDHSQAIRLSRTVQTIKNEGCVVKDASRYRPGEMERLLHRAEQLDAKLPTQTLITPVPVLNTYGGFEMFANGTTDLAPELFGWYGAPGIDPTAPTTTLFLVGDHFSPLRTQVIVGNQAVTLSAQSMLSRQVMQVTFVKGAYSLTGPNGSEVRIHVATPYGVTRELSVPVASVKPSPKAGFTVAPATLTIPYASNPTASAQKAATGNTPNPTGSPTAAPAAQPAGGTANNPTAAATLQYAALKQPKTSQPLKFTWVGGDPAAMIASNFTVSFVFSIPSATAGGPATTVTVPCSCGATATLAVTAPTASTTTAIATTAATASTSNGGTLTICPDQIDRIAYDLFQQDAIQQLAKVNQLPTSLTTTQILVTPTGASGNSNRVIATNDQLVVNLNLVGYCPDDVILKPATSPCSLVPCSQPATGAQGQTGGCQQAPGATTSQSGGCPPSQSTTTAGCPGFNFCSKSTFTLPYCKSGASKGDGSYNLQALPANSSEYNSSAISLIWTCQNGKALDTIGAKLTFTTNFGAIPIITKLTTGPEGVYTLDGFDVATKLAASLKDFGPFTDTTNPLTNGLPVTLLVPLNEQGAVVAGATAASLPLTLKFSCSICPPAPMDPGMPMVPVKPDPVKRGDGGKSAANNAPSSVGGETPLPLPPVAAPVAPVLPAQPLPVPVPPM